LPGSIVRESVETPVNESRASVMVRPPVEASTSARVNVARFFGMALANVARSLIYGGHGWYPDVLFRAVVDVDDSCAQRPIAQGVIVKSTPMPMNGPSES
jgi:hypothetical protein